MLGGDVLEIELQGVYDLVDGDHCEHVGDIAAAELPPVLSEFLVRR